MLPEHNQFKRPQLILFDVYETLLDMTEVEKKVNNLMDNKKGYTLWFELFMQYCFVDNCTAQFHNFTAIAKATMQMAARSFGESIDDQQIHSVLELLKHLPVHEGVQKGLSVLHNHDFRIAALTNSPQETVKDRMERTGLISYFEIVMSADQVKKYKPGLEVYEWACKKLKVPANEILMVSAHGWDLAGAANAGMQTAYMKQNKQMLYPLAPEPIFVCENIMQLAGLIEAACDLKTS